MHYWLIKNEPDDFSIDDLAREGKEVWSGVRNYQARNFMRDGMQLNDLILYYHSNAKPSGVVGVAKVIRAAYPDPTAQNPQSHYYDPKTSNTNPVWVAVDVGFVEKLPRIISLEEIKNTPVLNEMRVAQKGSRLSVQPVSEEQFKEVLRIAKTKS